MKSKHVNILNERPRRKNNKKALAEISRMKSIAFENDIKRASSSFLEVKKPEKEMNFLQAFIILLLAVFAFFLLQRAWDIHALNTCELHGDCAEVIRDINGK